MHSYKILLCGTTGAGKSSFINTIFSALRNQTVQIAHNAQDEKSVTKKFRVYKLRKSVNEQPTRVTLCDTMGFEIDTLPKGPSISDFEFIMDGYIRDGYAFKPGEQVDINSEFYNRNPGPMDKVHVVVVVVNSPERYRDNQRDGKQIEANHQQSQ